MSKTSLILALCGVVLLGSVSANATPFTGVDTTTAGFVGMTQFGPLDQPVLVQTYSQFLAAFGGSTAGLANPYLAPSAAGYFANGGQRLYVVRVSGNDDATLIGVDGGPGSRSGLQALLDVDEVSIVAIPGAVSTVVQLAMVAHCQSSDDRMALLDSASTDDVDAVLLQRANLNSPDGHGTLYFPWVQAAPAGVSLLLPASGFVAGAYSSSDAPDSPVGAIATASGVSVGITSPQQDALTQAGVNAIRYFPGNGVQIWGARTLSSDPEWRYVPVRRTALYLEESIHEGTEWAVFEPNDATLWASLESCVEDFLFGLYQAGWFQGASPQDAFFVRVDATTTTALDIAEGRTNILVGFAPLRPAEFVILRIVQQRETGTATPPLGTSASRLHPAAPNPFNPSTAIRFDLARPGIVHLAVYDLAGRRVRLLRNGTLGAGPHEVMWNGTDDAGTQLASGVYVVNLQATGRVLSRTLTLLK